MKIPFDQSYIPKIKRGEIEVETKNGRKVKIISWDAKSNGRPDDIIALVSSTDGSNENVWRYNSNGHLISDSSNNGDKDLYVILPDSPLKPLEDAMKHYFQVMTKQDGYSDDEITYEHAKHIMSIARDIAAQRLPKWITATCDMDSETPDYLIKFRHDGGDGEDWDEIVPTNRIKAGESYIELDSKFLNLPHRSV